MRQEACCTCAALLAAVPRASCSSEKPLPDDRLLDCCGRIVCSDCTLRNPRFLDYCPYCQTSGRSPPSATPADRSILRGGPDSDPPPYSDVSPSIKDSTPTTPPPLAPPPPPYTPSPSLTLSSSSCKTTNTPPPPPPPPPAQPAPKAASSTDQPPAYVIHHLRHPPDPNPDTLLSLSLQYGLPLSTLRYHNRLPNDADYLLAARHTLLIPTTTTLPETTTTSGEPPAILPPPISSLSPHPPDDPAARDRKIAIRRWMVACKEPDYATALVYLEASGYDFEGAVRRYHADGAWERANPLPCSSSSSFGSSSRARSRSAGGGGKGSGGDSGDGGGGGVAGRAKGKAGLGWWFKGGSGSK